MLNKMLILIPTYNERENIAALIEDIIIILPETDILVVDDNSSDGTDEIVQRLSKQHPQVKLITKPGRRGLGSSYVLGFKYALNKNYDFIFQMDADFSHHPRYLTQFLQEVGKYPLVLGSRYIRGGQIKGWNMFRKILSYFGNLYARCLLGLDIRDLTGGYKCYQREALAGIMSNPIVSDGYVFQIETTLKAHKKGFAIKEIPIIFENRCRGKSKISKKIIFEAALKIPLMRWLNCK